MSSLYRCRARVAYQPSGSKQLIVFDERQIQELNVKLKWKPNTAYSNAEASTPATSATTALSESTCSVTVSDPYLTGLAWPTLFDMASLYTQANVAAANNILLPACAEGQDPNVDKCVKFVDIDAEGMSAPGGDKYPFLLLSLWYDVKGTTFGTDFYFRINGFSISHGTKYPSVTIRGVDARSVLFNQSLVNMTLDEGMEIDKALKDLAEKQGFSVSFCANTNSDPTKKRVIPKSIRFTGVTTDEAIKRVLDSVSGNSLHLPTKEYANKISMCARGDVDQGCSVFYLGKGLYEGYEISGQPEITLLTLNSEQGGNRNNADPYLSEAFSAASYNIQDVTPNKRKKAMETVKKIDFPEIFKPTPPHIKNAPTTTGYVWRDSHPASSNAKGITVINEEASKVQKEGLNLFGIAPNGTVAISFLSGEVTDASEKDGVVKIKTKFSLYVCEKEGSQKCFFRPVLQESTGLSSVKVKARDKVSISQEIGSSTTEKPEFTRFYIMGHNNAHVTLNPKLVWDWAFPEEEIAGLQSPAISGPPANQVVTPAPKASTKDWNATTTAKPSKILITPGHADFISSGAPNEPALNIELVKWAQRNASAYGVQDLVEFYFPPSSNLSETDPLSLFKKTEGAVGQGKQVIEIHNDMDSGSSGVIPPRNGKRIWPLDNVLAGAYGSFSVNHRDGLGIPNRGGTILEVGRLDQATTRVFTSGTAAQKEALYKQLMDPLMRSIASEKSRNAGTATSPAPSPTPASAPASSGPIVVGRVGSTGRSTGPHLHAELGPFTQSGGRGQPITGGDVDPYVLIGGTPASTWGVYSPYGPRSSGFHYGIDFSGPGPKGENINGQPVSVTGGATIVETKKNWIGYGNAVIIKRPDGKEMILAHLQDDSIPPNIAGMTVSSGGGKANPAMQSAPATQGLTVETSFKGVPRSLRIIPGRTILSFVTQYDDWVDKNRPTDLDPGVWIPGRFKNWFVSECQYKWRDGDLRVQLEGVSAWGTRSITAPTFDNYLKGMRDAGEVKISTTYYDYIRSLGDLNWKTEDGKDSTEKYCAEAQALSESLSEKDTSESSDPPSPTGAEGSFPAANCKTGDANRDAIINALYSSGLKTKNAFAGVIGNMIQESGVNYNVHNGPRPGRGCSSTPSSVLGTVGYGLVQWCGGRADNLASTYKCGRNCSLNQQLSFLKSELQSSYTGMIDEMNAAETAGDAANIFMRKFERPGDPNGEEPGRRRLGEEVVKTIKCDRPS